MHTSVQCRAQPHSRGAYTTLDTGCQRLTQQATIADPSLHFIHSADIVDSQRVAIQALDDKHLKLAQLSVDTRVFVSVGCAEKINPFAADPVKALHFAILV